MAKIEELLTKIDESGLKEKLAACKSVDDILAIAKDLGIELDAEEIEKLTDVTAEDLAGAAGGGLIKSIPRLNFKG